MKEWNTIVIFSILNVLFEFASSVFLGGTISWRENQRKLRYTYRVTFGLGNGPCGSACSYTDIGKKTKAGKPFNETSWACVGCSNHFTGSDLNYVVTAIGENPRWEQGENVFEHRIKDTKFTMSMIIPSILSNTSRAVLTTIVDTRVRNDTHSMNSSPIAALPPYTGIPFGCVSNITLPVIDPDNDVIKCRWATSAECGQACTDLPEAYINENSCTIHINASKQTGYKTGHRYRVAVTVEDFPRFPIELASHILLPNQPISSIPLQFFIDVVSSSSGCKPVITFENKNFPDNKVASYSFLDFHNHVNFVFPVYLLSTRNITTFVQSFTQHINTTIIRNHSGSHHTLELYSKWRPVPQQLGENLLCVWGKDNEGVTTRKQCILGLIADSDECFSNPCHGSATCVNLYRRYACACPPGFKGSTCQKKITCDQNPCLNNGTCSVNSTFSCRCKHGFFGDLCQFEEQPCSSFPCKNGGNCISLSGIYRCLCPKNFIGHSCGKHHTSCRAVALWLRQSRELQIQSL
ncbi:uncharacterized protein LOC133178115 [Saccostrea echinata]|uniref:uncharacterized protein LOC133178115 n=1 Tax=Saccostrea echinata TaxID=191078 RepID=UPI002A8342DA|nr:uncharacterized protein LOC133178115 [Saccostrea echinata]